MPDLLFLAGSSSSSSSSSFSDTQDSQSSCEEKPPQILCDLTGSGSLSTKSHVKLPVHLSIDGAAPYQWAPVAAGPLSRLRLADEELDLGYESGVEGDPISKSRKRLESQGRPIRTYGHLQLCRPRGFTAPVHTFRGASNSAIAATICRPKRPLPIELAKIPLTPNQSQSPAGLSSGLAANNYFRATQATGIRCPSARRISQCSLFRTTPESDGCATFSPLNPTPSFRTWTSSSDLSLLFQSHQTIELVSYTDSATPRRAPHFASTQPTNVCTSSCLVPIPAYQEKQKITRVLVGLGIGLPSCHSLATPRASAISRPELPTSTQSQRRFSFPSHRLSSEYTDVASGLRLRPTVLTDSPSPIASLPPRVACHQTPDPEILHGSPRVLHRRMSRASMGLGLSLPSDQGSRTASISRMATMYSPRRSSIGTAPSLTCSPEPRKPHLRPTLPSDSPSPIIPLPRRVSCRESHDVRLPQRRLSPAPVGLGIHSSPSPILLP
jgi:hypothetical protein